MGNLSDMSDAPFPGIDDPSTPAGRNFRLLADIPLRLSVEVGSTSLKLSELLDLNEGLGGRTGSPGQ